MTWPSCLFTLNLLEIWATFLADLTLSDYDSVKNFQFSLAAATNARRRVKLISNRPDVEGWIGDGDWGGFRRGRRDEDEDRGGRE